MLLVSDCIRMKSNCLSFRGWIALAWPIAWVTSFAASGTLVGWNNLGMHCMDSDFSVMSILPPYNTIEAQLIVNGRLVTNGAGYTVTYQAIADPDGSINSTSIGKGNFHTFTAVATDNSGATTASDPIRLTVRNRRSGE
jgi:hypothetical protein